MISSVTTSGRRCASASRSVVGLIDASQVRASSGVRREAEVGPRVAGSAHRLVTTLPRV